MARSYTSSGDSLRNLSAAATGAAGTIAVWIKPNWDESDGINHYFWDYGSTSFNEYPGFVKASTGGGTTFVGFVSTSIGDQRLTVPAGSGIWPTGAWGHHVFRWSATARAYNVGGTLAAGAGAGTVANEVGLTIGNAQPGLTQRNADASLAYFARWDRDLDNAEVTAMAAGFSPLFFPRGLVDYRPMDGSPDRSWHSTDTLTVTGTSIVDNPRQIFPPRYWRAGSHKGGARSRAWAVMVG